MSLLHKLTKTGHKKKGKCKELLLYYEATDLTLLPFLVVCQVLVYIND